MVRIAGLASAAALAALSLAPAAEAFQSSAGHERCPPQLALAGLPPSVRAVLEEAHAEAMARPADSAVVGRLGMMLHAYEQHRLASVCYERARTLAPRALSWTYLSAVVAAELGDSEHAAALLRASIRLHPDYLAARLRLAEALLAAGDLEGSRAEYEHLTAAFPELAVAQFGLGRVQWALGEKSAAVDLYERAVSLSPDFGRAHYALALAYRDRGSSDLARAHLEAYRRAGSRQPAPADPLLDEVRSMRSTARDLIAEGARLGTEGRVNDAIALHLKALEADATASQAHVNLISLYGRAGAPAEAEAHYRKALSLQTNVAMAHYNYGVLLASGGRRAQARSAFEKALQADPFHAQAHNNLAALLAGEGHVEDAAAHYRQALASDPQHRNARFGLAGALLLLGKQHEAIGHLERLLDVEQPDTPRHKYALAKAWLASGDRTRARAYAEEAWQSALRFRQTELAGRIKQDLQLMDAGEQ